ncbi:MAG: flavodoxin-dependent (E)-4-hydroxy-3-methylbut-2-enyl-diphosphate synthase [Victivallales bacterium]|nr:flavodoxin-dependent (E)-4-hydroxy-3-methylbut-2-enyl-diphosphate synthase [Victivallales bacterium]
MSNIDLLQARPPGKTRRIVLGGVKIGAGAPVSIQSMTKTDTHDHAATLKQIRQLASAGCDIVRLAVPDRKAIQPLRIIVSQSPIPVVADIHFYHRLALGAIDAGAHGIRINPGNISDEKHLSELAEAAGAAKIPIRVGANSGSLPKKMQQKVARAKNRHKALADALVQSALEQCAMLEEFGLSAIKVSIKSPDVPVMVAACRKFSSVSDYPLHLGVTEAGTLTRGTVKSAVGIGALLLDGIGDTIRVSLTADPVEEVRAAILILEATGLRTPQPEVVSCPTCGRTEFDLMKTALRIENLVDNLKQKGEIIPIRKIAVMGCVVNGPGEAKDAEIGIAGVKGGKAAIFSHGESQGTFPIDEAIAILMKKIVEKSTKKTPR